MNRPGRQSEDRLYEQFLGLLRVNERKIFGSILCFVPERSIAEDIMQDVIVIMWRKFSDYREGSSFSAWGITIGRFLIMDYFRKEGRSIVRFSSEALENISEITDESDSYDDQMDALNNCIGKLSENSKQILKIRYQQGYTIKKVAEEIGKPVHSMYKLMAKIHHTLQQCVERNLSATRESL